MQIDYRKFNYQIYLFFDKVKVCLFRFQNKDCSTLNRNNTKYTLLIYLKDNIYLKESNEKIFYFDEFNEIKTFDKKIYFKIEFGSYLEMRNYLKKYGKLNNVIKYANRI